MLLRPFLFSLGPIPEASFGLVRVAASVSEWTGLHSLTLAATRIGEFGAGILDGLFKCPGACSGDLYSVRACPVVIGPRRSVLATVGGE